MNFTKRSGLPEFLSFSNKNTKKVFVTKNFIFFGDTHKTTPKWLIFLLLCTVSFLSACAQNKSTSNDSISLDTKIGQMLIVGFRGLKIDGKSQITQEIQQNKIGGVFLFDYDVQLHKTVRNIASPAQVDSLTSQLQKYANIPLLIAIDQEGGRVSRLKEKFGFPPSVSAQYLGKLNNTDSTRFYARRTATMLHKAGINVNLAPVVDLNINPDNPVIGSLDRSFSADPKVVTRQARVYIQELHKQNILTTLKHFPGHGSSKQDSHKGVVDVTQTWQRKELTPYRELIKSGDVDIIMTAHIYNARLDSTYPATLSKPVITGILRDSLKFDGVVMSDDLQMGAIRKEYGLRETIKQAINAGVDMLSFANNTVFDPKIADKAHRIIKELVENSEISRDRIDISYARIMKLKSRLSTQNR